MTSMHWSSEPFTSIFAPFFFFPVYAVWCTIAHCTVGKNHLKIWNMSLKKMFFLSWRTLPTLTNPSYLDRPFVPLQTLHTLTNIAYLNKPFILWQTLHTLTNPSYLGKSFILWQTLHTLTNPSYFDRPFIPWQILHTLTNPSIPLKPIHTFKNHSYIDNPFLSWQSILLRVCPQKQFAPSILCVRKWDIFS